MLTERLAVYPAYAQSPARWLDRGFHVAVLRAIDASGHARGESWRAGAAEATEVMTAFLGQFYENKHVPRRIVVSHDPPERTLIEEALSLRAGRRVHIVRPRRGAQRKLVEHALSNARLALARKLSESAAQRRLLEGLAKRLGLEAPPARIEVYDNSHISGTDAVGSMIVAGTDRRHDVAAEGAETGVDGAGGHAAAAAGLKAEDLGHDGVAGAARLRPRHLGRGRRRQLQFVCTMEQRLDARRLGFFVGGRRRRRDADRGESESFKRDGRGRGSGDR